MKTDGSSLSGACFSVLLAAAVLAGCASVSETLPTEESYDPSTPVRAVDPGTMGAIYREGSMELFADLRARNVGDVLTIALDEQTAATKQSSTNTSKSADLATSLPLFGGKTVTNNGNPLFSNGLSGDRSFAGAADASQSNQLDGSITVTVAERLANGNLLVKGEKWITLNQGKEYVRLSGIVRPIDIGPANTVSSTKVANAHITYSENGALAANNRPGWLSRFFDSRWFPF